MTEKKTAAEKPLADMNPEELIAECERLAKRNAVLEQEVEAEKAEAKKAIAAAKASQRTKVVKANEKPYKLKAALSCPDGDLEEGDEISLDSERATNLRNAGFID